MDALFKIKGNEFNEALFKKIKDLLRKGKNTSILIRVTDEQEVYQHTLEESIAQLNEPGELYSFTMQGLLARG